MKAIYLAADNLIRCKCSNNKTNKAKPCCSSNLNQVMGCMCKILKKERDMLQERLLNCHRFPFTLNKNTFVNGKKKSFLLSITINPSQSINS